MKTLTKAQRCAVMAASVLYTAVMVYLLFLHRIGRTFGMNWSEYVCTMHNVIPLWSVHEFFSTGDYSARQVSIFVVNFFGNIAAFVPYGILLPLFAPKARAYGRFLLVSSLLILGIECAQIFTMLGSFDVEDILLNLLGASLGFRCWKNGIRRIW